MYKERRLVQSSVIEYVISSTSLFYLSVLIRGQDSWECWGFQRLSYSAALVNPRAARGTFPTRCYIMQSLLDYVLLFGAIGISATISTIVLLIILRVQSNRRKGRHVKAKKTHKWTLKGRKEIVEEDAPVIEAHTIGEEVPESREKIHNVVGVIGSRQYKNKEMMFQTLDDLFGERPTDNIVFITGDAHGPDEWLVEWARSKDFRYDVFEVEKKESTFDRNLRIATMVNAIVAFVPRRLEKSGSKNCVSQFRKLGKRLYLVYDELGVKWDWDWKE
jgi:hypothetical protein